MDYTSIIIGVVIIGFLVFNLVKTMKKTPDNKRLVAAYVACLIGAILLFIQTFF